MGSGLNAALPGRGKRLRPESAESVYLLDAQFFALAGLTWSVGDSGRRESAPS